MKKISCIILDDEPMAVSLLSKYIEKIAILDLVKATTNPFEVLETIALAPVDLLFIDIQMPEISGIQMMELIGNKTKFIITSAYSEFALKGYEHNVVDYLLKPISFDRFYKGINKLQESYKTTVVDTRIKVEEESEDFIFVKTDGRLVKINLRELQFIEGLKDYLYLHLKNEKLVVLDTLKDFETKLPENSYMRIHKSYIIRLDQIETIERNRIFIRDKIIPIGDTYKARFQEWMKNFI